MAKTATTELDIKVMELYQEIGRSQGLNDPLAMSIFARLYLEPEPMSMDELARETGYSLASVSTKLRMLTPLLGIRRIKKPGTKKAYLYLEKDMLGMCRDALIRKEEHFVKKVMEKLPLLIKEYQAVAKTEHDKKKADVLEGYYNQIIKFGNIIKNIITELEKAGD